MHTIKAHEEARPMRGVRMARGLGAAGMLLFWLGAAVSACFFRFEDDCTLTYSCAQGTTSTGGSGDGGPNDDCIPSKAKGVVADACGVFVSAAGKDTGAGTKSAPVASLTKAMELAASGKGKGRVYACAEGFDEVVEVPAGVELYGGLDCSAGWAYAGESKRTALTAEEGAIPLRLLEGEGTTRVEDVDVKARDAVAEGGLVDPGTMWEGRRSFTCWLKGARRS